MVPPWSHDGWIPIASPAPGGVSPLRRAGLAPSRAPGAPTEPQQKRLQKQVSGENQAELGLFCMCSIVLMDVWPRKNGVFPPKRRFQTKSWDCLGQDWTGWNVAILGIDDWWPRRVYHPFFEHGTCRYWPRWLTWDPKNPKDLRWF